MLRGIWGDMDRYRETYWSRVQEHGWYLAGDGARFDQDGALQVLGPVDDVMNVSGHRIPPRRSNPPSSAITASPRPPCSAHMMTPPPSGSSRTSSCAKELTTPARTSSPTSKRRSPGPSARFAKPRQITIVPGLPKTRSGKIMPDSCDIAEGRELGDTSTLLDPKVFEALTTRAAD
jgi:acetyl-CoA synthetase